MLQAPKFRLSSPAESPSSRKRVPDWVDGSQWCRVRLVGRRLESLLNTNNELEAKGGIVPAASVDITDAAAIQGEIANASKVHGVIDILVNNASVADTDYIACFSLEKGDQVIDTNFRAPFLMCQEVASRLIATNRPG